MKDFRLRCDCELGHADNVAARRAELNGQVGTKLGEGGRGAGWYMWIKALGYACTVRNPLFKRFKVKENPPVKSRSEPADSGPSSAFSFWKPKEVAQEKGKQESKKELKEPKKLEEQIKEENNTEKSKQQWQPVPRKPTPEPKSANLQDKEIPYAERKPAYEPRIKQKEVVVKVSKPKVSKPKVSKPVEEGSACFSWSPRPSKPPKEFKKEEKRESRSWFCSPKAEKTATRPSSAPEFQTSSRLFSCTSLRQAKPERTAAVPLVAELKTRGSYFKAKPEETQLVADRKVAAVLAKPEETQQAKAEERQVAASNSFLCSGMKLKSRVKVHRPSKGNKKRSLLCFPSFRKSTVQSKKKKKAKKSKKKQQRQQQQQPEEQKQQTKQEKIQEETITPPPEIKAPAVKSKTQPKSKSPPKKRNKFPAKKKAPSTPESKQTSRQTTPDSSRQSSPSSSRTSPTRSRSATPTKFPAQPKGKKELRKKVGGETGTMSFFPFCASEVMKDTKKENAPEGTKDAKEKKERTARPLERKEVLNKGSSRPSSKERQARENNVSPQLRGPDLPSLEKPTKEFFKAGIEKLSKKDKAKLELQKRQEKPISFLDCPMCHKVYRYAVEIDCGHVFCSICIRRRLKRSKLCPICLGEIEYVHPSYILRELVQKFGTKDGSTKLKTELLQIAGYYDEYAADDPIVVASQFVPDRSGGYCPCNGGGGAFDPADLYKSTKLDDFVSTEEFLDTIKMVNQVIASCAMGSLKACLGVCFCFLSSHTRKTVNLVEVVLGDCNLKWPETGLFWTLMYLDGDTRSACNLGEKFYLALRIDPEKARHYQNVLRNGGQKDFEMARLRKQNALMRHRMLELGQNDFVRSLIGRRSPRYSLKSGPSLCFTDEYPDSPLISPYTLRDLVLHNPTSKRYFIAPWNRLRSTSTGPLPLTKEEDYRIRHHFTSLSRSPERSISPVRRPRSPPSSDTCRRRIASRR